MPDENSSQAPVGLGGEELGASSLEYLLVTALLIGAFASSTEVLMSMLGRIYMYWIVVVSSPIL